MKLKILLLIEFIIIFTIITKMNAQSLTWLETLGGSTSKAIDVSDDGLIVVGIAQNSQERYFGFKWRESTGMVSLGTLGYKFSLARNYPNPFNPSTRISFSIPNEEFVYLKIFNSIGKEVKELVNETRSARNYIIDFNASDLTSGVYFYKLRTNSFIEVKKMILII